MLKREEQSAIHEAMEQQTLTINKAGIMSKINTRTAIIAAANPKRGRYDSSMDLSSNTGIFPSLLGRFDLIFVLLDYVNEQQDATKAKHILTEVGIINIYIYIYSALIVS